GHARRAPARHRHWHGRRAPAPLGDLDRRRPHHEPGPDPLHDARDLPLHGPPEKLDCEAAIRAARRRAVGRPRRSATLMPMKTRSTLAFAAAALLLGACDLAPRYLEPPA